MYKTYKTNGTRYISNRVPLVLHTWNFVVSMARAETDDICDLRAAATYPPPPRSPPRPSLAVPSPARAPPSEAASPGCGRSTSQDHLKSHLDAVQGLSTLPRCTSKPYHWPRHVYTPLASLTRMQPSRVVLFNRMPLSHDFLCTKRWDGFILPPLKSMKSVG